MKIKTTFFFLLFLSVVFINELFAQERPKLVVGIVVDQMRFDYLYRFQKNFGKNGFKHLMKEGSNFTYAHYNYSQTSTALGHATIYTGTTPFYHGVIGNDWYDRTLGKRTSSVNDPTENTIGSNDKEGNASPKRLLSTTITDQLKLGTGGKSKIISVSLKDRSAILPGGHLADQAYWYNVKTGDFITSSYYTNSLPQWVTNFNEKKLALCYAGETWALSGSVSDYSISNPDESPNEEDVFSEGKTSFPHSLQNIKNDQKNRLVEFTPYGNTIVAEFAKAAIESENLGKGNSTDFLAISFSSTDIIAHSYGSLSYEVQDTYIKLDETIADLLRTLDNKVGKENYLLFLSADHAGMETPGVAREKRLPTGGLNNDQIVELLKSFTAKKYGSENLIENFSNRQIFLNRNVIQEKNLDIHEIEKTVADLLRNNIDMISVICTRDQLEGKSATREPFNTILNGFNPAISGDIAFDVKPGLLPKYQDKGTTHGSPYTYDTHVPMIFYGWRVPPQTVNTPVYTVDIAATIADLLKITEPSACIGIPLIK
jgi:predicted AlkP superfamily pyrophosphatase or phosphodiesterase